MSNQGYTKEDITRLVKEHHVKFVRLQFTDIHGIVKNVEITASQLDKALNNEIMFDGSSIEGFTRIEESDMYLYPDLNTFAIFPWLPQEDAVARLICDIYTPDGKPFMGCPRYALKRVLQEARDLGYSFNVGPEMEFFLFKKNADGVPTTEVHDKGGYFDLAPLEAGEPVRRDMVLALEKMGFEIEAAHHEVADGQSEIDFKYADALTSADNIQTFKIAVKSIAARHNLHVSFMAKPVFGINGSGMHCNQSLFAGDKNAFLDESKPLALSDTCMHYIAGLLTHARGMAAITNPLVNSYKRLVPGYEAPVYIAWSGQNRSPLIRIPAKRGLSTRIELRNPDPSCNPYLAMAVMLAAGLDGIKRKLTPPPATDRNIYHMTGAERKEEGIGSLPGTLYEAVQELEKDDVVKKALGEHITKHYVAAKLQEWDDYRIHVTEWELDRYLALY